MTDPRYPIGPWVPPVSPTHAHVLEWIDQLAALPAQFRAALGGLDDGQLDTPYRDGGWTLRQVAHHVPDSHMNGYVRHRLALTADTPTIMPYDEAAWAEQPDYRRPITGALDLLDQLHERWVHLLSQLPFDAFDRSYIHPEAGRRFTLAESLSNYTWHGRHHTAHVTRLREARGW